MSDTTIEQLSAMPDAEINALARRVMAYEEYEGEWHPCTSQDHAFELQAKAIERDARAYIDALANSPDRATNRLKP